MFWNTGSYKEVVANKKIVSTMSFSNENGKIIPGSQVSVPGQWPNEITVIVAFSESEGKARVTEMCIRDSLALARSSYSRCVHKNSTAEMRSFYFSSLPVRVTD